MKRLASITMITMAALAGSLPGASPAEAQARAPSFGGGGPNELDRLLVRAENEERTLSEERASIEPALEVINRRMVARGRAYYKLLRAGLLPAGSGFEALVDHAARVERMRRALERDVLDESTLQKRKHEIDERLERLRAERAPLELQREAMQRARAALAEADERRAAFTRAFEASVRPGSVAIYGADMGPEASDTRAGFRAQKGRLPFPIAGRAEVRRIGNAEGGPAVELKAPVGSVVRSVAAGRVVFVDRYDAYGLTVILDHGDHYFSLYANLGGTELKVGDGISSGARVGTVGTDALAFELRLNAERIDPGPWLGI